MKFATSPSKAFLLVAGFLIATAQATPVAQDPSAPGDLQNRGTDGGLNIRSSTHAPNEAGGGQQSSNSNIAKRGNPRGDEKGHESDDELDKILRKWTVLDVDQMKKDEKKLKQQTGKLRPDAPPPRNDVQELRNQVIAMNQHIITLQQHLHMAETAARNLEGERDQCESDLSKLEHKHRKLLKGQSGEKSSSSRKKATG